MINHLGKPVPEARQHTEFWSIFSNQLGKPPGDSYGCGCSSANTYW